MLVAFVVAVKMSVGAAATFLALPHCFFFALMVKKPCRSVLRLLENMSPENTDSINALACIDLESTVCYTWCIAFLVLHEMHSPHVDGRVAVAMTLEGTLYLHGL